MENPISRDKIERQKFKENLSSKIHLTMNPPALPTRISSVEMREQEYAQQRLEIQAKDNFESQQLELQKAKEEERINNLSSQIRPPREPRPVVAKIAKEERIAIRADLLSQIEKDSQADIERLEAMRLKSKSIIDASPPLRSI